jgi:predicted CXXCH cytochrome family protein
MVIFTASSLKAATHPVPLDPKVDSKACLQCHEDKTKGKAVHSAIQTGCLSCHEVRVNKDVTRVKLITATPQGLCITCHSDKNAAEIHGKVHSPAVRDCLKCHDPHTTDTKNQLLKPASGETKADNLCLSCHTQGTNVPKGGSRHAALDMGCDTCHVTHKTGEAGKREFDFHLTKNAPELCLGCHDAKDASLQKAHQGQPFATADCVTCHDPHQSTQTHLMAKFTHMPFAGGQCDTCHAAPKDGKVVLTNASAKQICLTCHAEQGEKIERAKVQHPGAAGDCTDCHNPHAGNSPGFAKPDAVNVCLSCHTDQAEQHKKAHLHQPAFEQGCATCHEPHGGDNAKLLRAATPNTLCLECHGPDRDPVKVEADHMVTIFDGKVKLPEDYFARVTQLPIKYGAGHPTEHHPVTDRQIAGDGAPFNMKINCLTCHQPHSSKQPGMLVADKANNMDFCHNCHENGMAMKKQQP